MPWIVIGLVIVGVAVVACSWWAEWRDEPPRDPRNGI
jgi:hypothetical protein